MFGEFKVQAGDFDTIRKGIFVSGSFSMPRKGTMMATDIYQQSRIEALEVASEDSVKRVGGTAGWGIAGAALLGPVGLLAGLLVGGRGKDVTFIVKFDDGKKALCTASSKLYAKMQSAMF